MNKIGLFILLPLAILIMFGCSSDSSGPSDDSNDFDDDLVGTWNLISYNVNGDDQGWNGYLTFQTNGNFNGMFKEEIKKNKADSAIFSGNATTSGDILTSNITEANNPPSEPYWVELGTTEWFYEITNNNLYMECEDEGDTITINWTETQQDYGSISGVVTETDKGSPLEGVKVEVLTTGLSATTEFDGSYLIQNIPVGSYDVKASKTGYNSETENDVDVNKDQTTNVDFALEQTASGAGTVMGFVADVVSQTLIEGANITINETGLSAYSDGDGIFTITDVPIGNYDITCTKSGYEEQTINDNEVTDNDTIYVDFLLIPEGYVDYGTLVGTVTSTEKNTPISNVLVQVVGTYNTGLTDDTGYYEVYYISEGTYSVNYIKLGYQTKTIDDVIIISGEDTQLDVELTPESGTSTLICYVDDANTSLPLSDVNVEILNTTFNCVTNILGNCTIPDIPASVYSVKFSKIGYVVHQEEDIEFFSGIPTILNVSLQSFLSSFTATYMNEYGYPLIEWTTATETNLQGFNVYRNDECVFETAIQLNWGLIPGHGTSSIPHSYEFQDLDYLEFGTIYYYWLESVDLSLNTELYGPIEFVI